TTTGARCLTTHGRSATARRTSSSARRSTSPAAATSRARTASRATGCSRSSTAARCTPASARRASTAAARRRSRARSRSRAPRRRCKVIIACDAEQDASLAFGSFTEALRQVYVDEGISVDIDLSMVRPDPVTGLSRSHCAVGRILYPDRRDQVSYLIYLKNSLTGDEPEPVLNYKVASPAFPHESTA